MISKKGDRLLRPVLFFVLFLLAGLTFVSPSLLLADSNVSQAFDHSTWNEFLKTFVNEKGEVDYAGVKKNPALLETYLKQLRSVTTTNRVFEGPREERMALLINAYHAGLVDQIRQHYPIKEVGSIPNFWEWQFIAIGEGKYSLNGIRTMSLIKTFRDVKIHTVLSWGARGGPKLQQEAFTGPLVEGQLFMAAREFVNNPDFVRITPGKKKIEIAKLFQWHAQDFMFNFYHGENGRGFSDWDFSVLSFIVNYLDDTEKIRFLENEKYKIKYISFDWSLNEWVRKR
ncbi:MAG: DUF547 domain-containing protein [Candidatus Omnitrophica bacterium]|nr:DUF547 domain-containing protein [Candidatus Omnitrophota bacterium]